MTLDGLPLSPKQVRSIVESQRARIACWAGAVRSGKTVASLVAFLVALADAPASGLVLAVGRTLQTIERNLFEPLQDRALFGPLVGQVRHTRGSTTAEILGRTVHLIGASDARAEGKLRGLTACLALVDEATLVPEEFFTQLLARLSVPGARCLLTTNPGPPRHWLRQRFLLRAGELDLAHWHFTLDDNPFLDPAYVAAVKREFVGVWYRRMVEGLWVQAEGAVFPMFDEDRHVVADLPRLVAIPGVGVDYGTVNPFAALMLAVTADGRLCFTREYRHDPTVALLQLTDADFSAELRAWIGDDRPEWVAVDPSAASFKLQLWRDGLSNVVGADNAVVDGIRLVASLFATDRLVIHDSCRGLLDEIPGYSWDSAAAEKGEDKPVKVDDHSSDAGRYVLKTTESIWRPMLRPTTLAA